MRKTKTLFWNCPTIFRFKSSQSNPGTNEIDEMVDPGANEQPNTNLSNQGEECLLTNMCCLWTVIQKIFCYNNSNIIEESRASVYESRNQDNRYNVEDDNLENVEMLQIQSSDIVICHAAPNDLGNGNILKKMSCKNKNGKLSATPDLIKKIFSKSEGNESTRRLIKSASHKESQSLQ